MQKKQGKYDHTRKMSFKKFCPFTYTQWERSNFKSV